MQKKHRLITEEEIAALEILRQTRVKAVTAAIVAREVLAKCRGSEARAYKCITLGVKALKEEENTVSFARAVQEAMDARQDLRERTKKDYRYITKRLMTRCPELANKRVRSISARECAAYLTTAFDTERQQLKAHAVMSAIFHTAQRKGWCSANPMQEVQKPRINEKRINILTNAEIERLMHSASTYRHGICLAAVALMLFAGLRPQEVARLTWQDINLTHNCISISPQHSKTGGARKVTICPALKKILLTVRGGKDESICPRNWNRHWSILHKKAGFKHWQPDVLRHTFASHYLAHYRNYESLQVEMGHRSAALLRTRYVAMPMDNALIFKQRQVKPESMQN